MREIGMPAQVLLAAFLVTAGASSGSGAGDEFESGDSWAYDIDMTMESLLLSGTTTYAYEGESSKSVAGYTYSTYEMRYLGSLTVTGSVEGHAVTGTATLNGVDSLDRESLNVVVSDYTMSMSLSVVIGGTAYGMDYSEHNVSTYSPPGGVGDEPEDPDEGTSWTKTYTVHYETTINDDGDITAESSSISVTETCTFLGVKTITVPAGTFICEVMQTDYGDGIATDWYCVDVGTYVKSVYESGSTASGTELLTSFSYTPPPSGGALSNAMMLLIASIVVVAIVVVVVVWILVRRKSPPDGQQEGPVTQGPGSPNPPAG